MTDFHVDVVKSADFAVLRSHGYINNLGGEKIAEECYRMMDQSINRFIVNLDGSKVVNSIGISILIEIIEKVMEKKGRLAFSNLTPTIAKTFRIMGLLQYAELFEDESAAARKFQTG